MNLRIFGNATTGYKGAGESDTEVFFPCPFCGSLNIRAVNTHTPSYWTECQDCGAQGPRTTYPRREAKSKPGVKRQHKVVLTQAVQLWNQRASNDEALTAFVVAGWSGRVQQRCRNSYRPVVTALKVEAREKA